MITSDKSSPSKDQINDSEPSWLSQIWKNLANQEANRPSAPSEGPRQPSSEMLAMEDTGALPNCRTSC